MTHVRKTGDPNKYEMPNRNCLSAECFQPGEYQHRGATGAGSSRNTGESTFTCMRSAYWGCPAFVKHSKELKKERRAEGWRIVR
jgi:hypothetical protein